MSLSKDEVAHLVKSAYASLGSGDHNAWIKEFNAKIAKHIFEREQLIPGSLDNCFDRWCHDAETSDKVKEFLKQIEIRNPYLAMAIRSAEFLQIISSIKDGKRRTLTVAITFSQKDSRLESLCDYPMRAYLLDSADVVFGLNTEVSIRVDGPNVPKNVDHFVSEVKRRKEALGLLIEHSHSIVAGSMAFDITYAPEQEFLYKATCQPANWALLNKVAEMYLSDDRREKMICRVRLALTKGGVMRPFVKLYRDGDALAVQSNIAEEVEFMRHFTEAIAIALADGKVEDTQFIMSKWIPQGFEIMAKLRGYKSDVEEQRLLTAGGANWKNDPVADTSGPASPENGQKVAPGVSVVAPPKSSAARA